MSSAEIEHSILHSILPPAANRIQFFDIQYFYLTFALNFCGPGPALAFTWTSPGIYLVSKKHSISRVLRHSTFGTEGLQAILKGVNRKKTIQFC